MLTMYEEIPRIRASEMSNELMVAQYPQADKQYKSTLWRHINAQTKSPEQRKAESRGSFKAAITSGIINGG